MRYKLSPKGAYYKVRMRVVVFDAFSKRAHTMVVMKKDLVQLTELDLQKLACIKKYMLVKKEFRQCVVEFNNKFDESLFEYLECAEVKFGILSNVDFFISTLVEFNVDYVPEGMSTISIMVE